MVEQYQCQDCGATGVLSKHGRCPACGSNAVMSEELLPCAERAYRRREQLKQVIPMARDRERVRRSVVSFASPLAWQVLLNELVRSSRATKCSGGGTERG